MEDRLEKMIREVDDFLMGKSKVHRSLERVTRALDEARVDFALAGGLAVGMHGYVRVTVDVDILVTPEGLGRFKELWLGRGFAEKFPGSRGLRDTETGVSIDFLLAGEYPGDGAPKPVRFPDPVTISREPGKIRILDLRTLVELKVASGISTPDRLRDLADVIELIRIQALPEDFDSQLDPTVRDRYRELWRAAQAPRREL